MDLYSLKNYQKINGKIKKIENKELTDTQIEQMEEDANTHIQNISNQILDLQNRIKYWQDVIVEINRLKK